MRQKSYRQIEQSRNTRLWITSVFVPLFTAGAALYSQPDIRRKVNEKASYISHEAKITYFKTKNKVTGWLRKFKKGEEQ